MGNRGQAALEYVLGITLALLVTGILLVGIRRPVQAVWRHWVERVSASCPNTGCAAQQ